MADSLRDQLIAAGFEAPKKPVKKTAKKTQAKKRRPNAQGRNASGKKEATTGASKAAGRASKKDVEAEAEILKRKKQKAEIKELIDNNKLENWKGEVAYRYTVEKRIRELYVNEPAHKELAARAVAITRLNGNTYLIPAGIATGIVKINPQWSVFNTDDDKQDQISEDDEYSEFQVPDDLKW